jgi:hypothetical protein
MATNKKTNWRKCIGCSIPQKGVRVFRLYNGYPAGKDNRDSWETCTTSAECKTVIIVMLTVMSGMDLT